MARTPIEGNVIHGSAEDHLNEVEKLCDQKAVLADDPWEWKDGVTAPQKVESVLKRLAPSRAAIAEHVTRMDEALDLIRRSTFALLEEKPHYSAAIGKLQLGIDAMRVAIGKPSK